MLEFLRPIINFSIWLYIGLGLLGLIFLRVMWLARKDRTRSIFTLERENANVRLTRAFAGFMIILAGMLGVYYLSVVTPDIVPPPPDTPTPTPIIGLPDTPTPPPLLLPTPTPTPTTLPTPTSVDLLVEANNTPPPPQQPPSNPVSPQGQPPNCGNSAARITQPGNNAQVAGVVQVMGSAAIDNFEYYKFEFRDPTSDEWVFISRFDNIVPSGVLGPLDINNLTPGEYDFRLVVVDNTGNFPEPCVVRLRVQ